MTVPARVHLLLVNELGVEESKVVPEASLIEDLQMDSLDRVEIAMGLEEEFGFDISDDEGNAWRTVADILATVAAKP